MELPYWLRTVIGGESPLETEAEEMLFAAGHRHPPKRREKFLDRTLSHILSFIEDVMFNERMSEKKGLLQAIEPGLKIITLLLFIVALSFQRSLDGVALFLVLAAILVIFSRIPLPFFAAKVMPSVVLTFLIAMPAAFSPIVNGEPLLVIHDFGREITLGPVTIPREIAITKQGVKSGSMLLLRVATSVSFVLLMTMTTLPNRLMKGASSLFPGFLGSVLAISYRYALLLVRKVEQFIMGFRSRSFSTVGSSRGRHWVASRIGLLFSISMELSNDLSMAMESRGYRGQEFKIRYSKFRISGKDALWLFFALFFCGVMFWRSFA